MALLSNGGEAPKYVGLALVLLLLSIAFRPAESITHRPLVEDGYYALSVARNVALGQGVTIDGVHPTNGFQPLFTFLCVIPYLLVGGAREGALHGILLLHWAFWAGSAYLFGAIARDLVRGTGTDVRAVFWWSFLLFSSSVLMFVVSFNGLETGALVFLFLLLWRHYQVHGLTSLREKLLVGVLLGLLVLARIDALVFAGIFALAVALHEHRESRLAALRTASLLLLTAVVTSLPWWLFNYLGFGAVFPTSGRAYAAFLVDPDRSWKMTYAVTRILMPVIYAGQNTFEGTPTFLVRTILIGVVIAALVRQRHRHPELSKGIMSAPAGRRGVLVGVVMLGTAMTLAVLYALTFGATWFYTRYLAPYALPALLVLAMVVSRLRSPVLQAVAAGLLALPLAGVVGGVWTDRFRSEFIDDQVRLVEEHIPPGDEVAAFQTGTLGYFRDRTVNLDGKVNPDAITYRADLLGYVERRGILWLCDEESSLTTIMGTDRLRKGGWQRMGARGVFALYKRDRSAGMTP
jgi:hypothetical protein